MTSTSTPTVPVSDATLAVAAKKIVIVAWPDAILDATAGAHRTASDDALVWYTPLLGPTAMLMAHRFALYAAEGPSTWTIANVARTFGLGRAVGRVAHVFDRLERFEVIARQDPNTIAVRLALPPLRARQRLMLPAYLADVYPS